mgnify:CR=1 FL=1
MLSESDQIQKLTFVLNYGGSKCEILQLKAYARQKLGSRQLVFLEENMSYADFVGLVREHSALIYNHYRQQGIGTLNIALHFGLKVFVRSDCSTFPSYRAWGIQLGDTCQLVEHDFKCDDIDLLVRNRGILKEKFHPESCAKKFNELFLSKLSS